MMQKNNNIKGNANQRKDMAISGAYRKGKSTINSKLDKNAWIVNHHTAD